MNVSGKILFKVSGLSIKKHLINPKINSNLVNPEYKKIIFPFIYSIAQNQPKLYYNPNT